MFNFDFSKVDAEENGFSLMPEGEYEIEVIEAPVKKTKSGTGAYINFKYKINSPEKYSKRFVWDIVNVKNDSPKAVEIGMARLKRMLELSGFSEEEMKGKKPEDLIGKKFLSYLKHQKSAGYKDKEVVATLEKVAEQKQEDYKADPNVPADWFDTGLSV